ncbi:RNA polymerase sigma factor [Amycolatopsis plumensis]|uniref:RNA polymerase sigma factor n=1 Tax=Amycolatopsis plumensis TaxID=236508 RepID=UPI0036086E4F
MPGTARPRTTTPRSPAASTRPARLRVLAAELAELSEQDRDVLLLTSWAGLEPAEVAEALGVPASTVRSRLHRVRHRLQALLAPTEENQS